MELYKLIIDKDEQKYIVDTLDAVAEIIRLRKENIQLTKDLIPTIFHEMFGDPERKICLADVATIKGGKRLPYGGQLQDETTVHPYIRVADMVNNTIKKDELKYISDVIYNKIQNYTISSRDVYISIAGTIGRVGLVPDNLEGANLTENAAKIPKKLEQSFHELIQKVEEQLPAEQCRTNAVNAELMKKIVQSIKGNNYIVDLAAGLGGLVWQLDHIDCIQDINSDILEVAEFIAHQNENYNVSVRLLDSIKEPFPNEGKGVFLFDPPMGLQREKPQEWEQFEKSSRVGMAEAGSAIAGYNLLSIWDIIGKNYKNTSSYTEILFIINFFPSKFKKKLSGIFSDITPKQFFNLNYFDAHEHRCCLCGRLLDHDAKELPVAEIEHLFPQSKFPQLILCISNYIPCCSNCNKIKKSSFFSCKKEFIEDLQKLGKSFHHPLFFWKLFDANFDYNLPAVKKCDIVQYYKINERFNQIRHYMYSNLFNLVKYHNIETPEALESFLESCQNANMQEMVSDFSLNNHPKLWHDFIDYVLYDYNNLTALWEEIKEYNKLKYYC